MTDNRTTELRERLDELGIEHTDASYKRHIPITAWRVAGATFCYVDSLESTDLHIDDATPKQAIAATLGGSTLTAEQVRKVVEGHGNIMDNRLYEDWQAVADELNATLGGEECRIICSCTNNLMYPDYMTKWYELSCGHSMTLKGEEAPKWCAVCGKAVKR